ncbi:hypothetical protein AB0L75_42725 [Streptomyces sp. NPDC052101]|uniref:hypothetical protein n=1 Tax=Streptomyces sp. NPDC052101 TaxID=3155763 RepID=UPI003424C063
MSDQQSKTPYVIKGRGKDKCPAGSFCLFADIEYNTSGSREAILVIPEGSTANNFSDYGFDHTGDGVSAVVNNTAKGNVLFNKIDQQGKQLPVPAGTAMADLTKYKLEGSPDGTWNDQAQSALATAQPVPVPVITEPKADAKTTNRRQPVSGTADPQVTKVELYNGSHNGKPVPFASPEVKDGKWSYTPNSDWPLGKQELHAMAVRGETRSGRVYRNFYVAESSPVVQIVAPKDGAKVDAETPVDGIALNADTVELAEGSTPLGKAPVTSGRWTFIPKGGWAMGSHTVTAVAVKGEGKSPQAKVGFTVEKKNLTVAYKLVQDPWEDWETKGWIYPYDITLKAGATDVERWRVGFGELPSGTVLFKEFVKNFWGVIVEDGSNGRVQLGSPPPEKGKHIVPKGETLTVRIQVLYPAKDDAFKKLYRLYAEDWSGK